MKVVKDVIDYNLELLIVGINPGIETSRTGNHFAHRSNRFWSTLFKSGLTTKLLKPEEKEHLLSYKIGITNVISRATKSEKELKNKEYEKGRAILLEKIKKYEPKWVAFIGLGLYRKTFSKPNAVVGKEENIYKSRVWVLPQTSGLNAHYPPVRLVEEFTKLKAALGPPSS